MANRTSIILALIDHISRNIEARGFRGLRFLHEINDWPSFYIHPKREQRVHYGDNNRFGLLQCDLRAYTWSDSLDVIEQLIREIEVSIDSFKRSYPELVQESRVLSIQTDEGLFAPYSIADLQFEVLYDIENSSIIVLLITVDSTLYTVDSTLLRADMG